MATAIKIMSIICSLIQCTKTKHSNHTCHKFSHLLKITEGGGVLVTEGMQRFVLT